MWAGKALRANSGKKKSGASFGKQTRKRVLERDGYRCVECGMSNADSLRVYGQALTMDHKVPRARGGTNAFENLQSMCFGCNEQKRDY